MGSGYILNIARGYYLENNYVSQAQGSFLDPQNPTHANDFIEAVTSTNF